MYFFQRKILDPPKTIIYVESEGNRVRILCSVLGHPIPSAYSFSIQGKKKWQVYKYHYQIEIWIFSFQVKKSK